MTAPNNTTPIQQFYCVEQGLGTSDPFVTVYADVDPTIYDVDFPIQKRWVNFLLTKEWILESLSNATPGIITANWVLLTQGPSGTINFPVPFGITPVVPSGTGAVTLKSTDASITITGGLNYIDFKNNASISSQSITGDDNVAITPSGGTIGLQGLVVANATHSKAVFTEEKSAHVEYVEVQLSAAIASTNVANVGLCAFDNSAFSVDSNGFVTFTGIMSTSLIPDMFTSPGTSPIVPNGSGNITITGSLVAAGTNPVRTDSLAANTMEIEVQTSQAIASTNATNVGLAAFSAAQFTVDANGFVTLIGGSTPPTLGLTPQTYTGPGTSPVVPNSSGDIVVSAYIIDAGGIPIQTNSTAANRLEIDLQLSSATGSSSETNAGVSSYNSAQFTVDANGYVALIGGSTPPTLGLIPDAHTGPGTTPVVPNGSGNIIFSGSVVAAGTNPVRTDSLAANTVEIEVQTAQAIAGTNASNVGLAAFNSANFTVDSNGFVSLKNTSGSVGFGVGLSGTLSNVTGDNTVYIVLFNSVLFDLTSNYNPATGLFTAPVTGIYSFTAYLLLTGLNSAYTTGKMIFFYNGTQNFASYRGNFGFLSDAGDNFAISIAANVMMTAGDTMGVDLQIAGGSKSISILVGSYFSGVLIS